MFCSDLPGKIQTCASQVLSDLGCSDNDHIYTQQVLQTIPDEAFIMPDGTSYAAKMRSLLGRLTVADYRFYLDAELAILKEVCSEGIHIGEQGHSKLVAVARNFYHMIALKYTM